MIQLIKKGLQTLRRNAITIEEEQVRLDDINSAYGRIFSSNDGKYVLEHMVKMHLVGSIAVQGDTLLDIGVKQGMANHVKEIIQRMEKANNG